MTEPLHKKIFSFLGYAGLSILLVVILPLAEIAIVGKAVWWTCECLFERKCW